MTTGVKIMSGQKLRQALEAEALRKARQRELAAAFAEAAITHRRAIDDQQKGAVADERVALAVLARVFGGAKEVCETLDSVLGADMREEFGLEVKVIEAAERVADGVKVEAAVQGIIAQASEPRPRRRSTRRVDGAEATGREERIVGDRAALREVADGPWAMQKPQTDDRSGAQRE
ncbi:hypothetical protein [Streptosporangium canum]|uniref:hypothetical protein n=1 Tax=Streptosporangium canum TaxID=324952 RepID=UPI0037AD494D